MVLVTVVVKVTVMQEETLAPEAEKTKAGLGNKMWPQAQHRTRPTGCPVLILENLKLPCTASAPGEKGHTFEYHKQIGIHS